MVKLSAYVVEHDMGFAPNPFFGVCTLSACKPQIRAHAQVGDYLLGVGSTKRGMQGRAVYLMRVGEILTFDQYWNDRKFGVKKPVLNGSTAQQFGDNIYHHDEVTGKWIQEDCFHSLDGGVTNCENLKTDTGTTEQVLVGDWFVYWGQNAPKIPPEFADVYRQGIARKNTDDPDLINRLVDWAKSEEGEGMAGLPIEWQYL